MRHVLPLVLLAALLFPASAAAWSEGAGPVPPMGGVCTSAHYSASIDITPSVPWAYAFAIYTYDWRYVTGETVTSGNVTRNFGTPATRLVCVYAWFYWTYWLVDWR